jgi:hypothetical protein
VAGGLTFVVINTALDSWVAKSAGDPYKVPGVPPEAAEDISGAEAEQTERMEEAATRGASAAVGFALLAAVTLDGVPENLALGVSLLSGGGSIVLLVAIFCSNFPESLVGAVAMRRGGRSAPFADAHFGEKHTHGTPFRRAVEEGLLLPERSIQVGMRGSIYDAGDWDDARELGFDLLPTDAVRKLGIEDTLRLPRGWSSGPPYVRRCSTSGARLT